MKNSRYIISHSQAEALKSGLVKRLSAEYADVGEGMVRQAVREADALASLTFAPLLVLPDLAEEKVQQAAGLSARGHSLLRRGSIAFAA